MLFNTPVFAVFFVVVLALYWPLRRFVRAQNLLIVVASYIFYGWWDVRFLYLAILSSILDFYCALMIDEGRISGKSRASGSILLLLASFFLVTVRWGGPSVTTDHLGWEVFGGTLAVLVLANALYPILSRLPEEKRRKVFITVSVAGQLTILGFFKYFNFFAGSFSALAESTFGVSPGMLTLNIVLPVGISFYTFQTMSYTIDVYRREIPACRSLLDFSAFVAFFPQLVAGPIERARHMLPQFQAPRHLSRADLNEGAWLIAWGLYKKMVVADNMYVVVQSVFGPFDWNPGSASVPDDGLRVLMGVYAFAFQIYGDFSGYTDIARGTARLLGFKIMLNFDLPYFATSPSSFWRRWHISLSTWLRDYLYISLGGNRGGASALYRNLMLTMLLGGLWHGASWTFVLWGFYQGALLVAYRVAGVRTEQGGYPRWVLFLMGVLMFHLTCLGWLFFRAQNLKTVWVFLQAIVFHLHGSPGASALFQDIVFYGWFLVTFDVLQGLTEAGLLRPMPRWNWALRLNVWMLVLVSLAALTPQTPTTFIYFAF